MKAFTLLTAALLLVAIAAAPNRNPNPNLNAILDTIKKMHHNGTQDYEECLSNLTEGPKMCRHPFFCKVHDILENRKNKKTPEKNHETEIRRQLEQYLHSHNVTCSRVLKNVTTSTTTVPMPQFWEKVEHCIRHRNTEKS